MIRPRDPRVRQRINQISHNLETANETAQEGLYTFSHDYIVPCLSSIGNCVYACAAPCLPTRQDHIRRRRRDRAEASFDFYDDWDNEEGVESGLLGFGTEELDRLLAGSGLTRGGAEQPRRQRRMSYGARRVRRKSTALAPDSRSDPTVIPSSSFLGFLERFPWRMGARGVKYRPSAADLQEHPTGLRRNVQEDEPLLEEAAGEEDEGQAAAGGNGRYRSSTQSSRETANSLSSRGDLFPSDEEEDAVPLDDEFALTLASRRSTGLESDDYLGDKPESMRSMSGTFSVESKDSKPRKAKKSKKKKSSRLHSTPSSTVEVIQDNTGSAMEDLQKEEQQAAIEEEARIIQRRLAARQLAAQRGLNSGKHQSTSSSHPPQPLTIHSDAPRGSPFSTPMESAGTSDFSSDRRLSTDQSQTEPFPPMPFSPSPEPSETTSGHAMTSVDRAGPSDDSRGPPTEPGDE
ncbi:hypothetical protein P168DRAFT_320663 [Aspergillus campestris IBT 28561]|uniref:Uncharacterized protein n=1 Tax=Aspergillus campestris (strain IBT 28561) TaxID=1392248 RepID=A0A2I1CWV0_ASPC2|nr:uncharacterized protein P168DRAFT_320663 [Aspergillus campestris IBT 28561]PKY02104.1 hypothetical protein P168DRAFT_320663 [Aspergillus campestris IBT 28561]